jgi:hypothetical protein
MPLLLAAASVGNALSLQAQSTNGLAKPQQSVPINRAVDPESRWSTLYLRRMRPSAEGSAASSAVGVTRREPGPNRCDPRVRLP